MKLLSTILLFAIFTTFSVSIEGRDKAGSISVEIHQEKSVPSAGFKIKFVEMVEDSRCPEGTNCIWAGNAKVKIEVRGKGSARSFELNSTTEPTVIVFSGYEIKFVGLTPKPAANVRIDPDKYLATFEVTKKTGK